MRRYLTTCLLCASLPVFAQVQLTPTTVPVPLEPGQSTTFNLVFSNPNAVAVPSQQLRANFFSLSAPFDTDFDVSPLSGACSDWEDGIEYQGGFSSTRVVRFSVPEVAANSSIACTYRIARRTTIQRNMDLRFANAAQPALIVVRFPVGVLSDIGATAQHLYTAASGTTFVHRYRITIYNYGAFDTNLYGFGVCDYPGVPRVRMNFPGGCNPDAPGQACFAVGFPQQLKAGLLPAGGHSSCELESYNAGPTPTLPPFLLSSVLARDSDGASMLDINPANDQLRVVSGAQLVAAPGLSTLAALGCALLLLAVAIVNLKRR